MIIGINGYAGSGKDTVGKIIQYLNSYNTGDITLDELITDHQVHEWWLEEQSGWEIKKWAGKLKHIASLLTGIPVEKFEDQEFKKTYLPEQWNYWTVSVIDNGRMRMQQGRYNTKAEAESQLYFLEEVYGTFRMEYVVGLQQMTVRQFLQELGTDACRNNLHPNTWVNALMADYIPKPNKAVADFLAAEGLPASMNAGEQEYPNWLITDTRFPNEAQAIKDKGGIVIRVNRPGVTAINAHSSETGLDNWKFDHVIENDGTLEQLADKVRAII